MSPTHGNATFTGSAQSAPDRCLPAGAGAADAFTPPFYLNHTMVQTFLGSFRLRSYRRSRMLRSATPMVLETPAGVKLGGAMSRVTSASPDGLVILLHGWKGSIDSTYMVNTADFLYERGFDIFRLNLRDHGGTHAMNRGMFYATLLDEVVDGVVQAAGTARSQRVFLCGFSLGGNFALRLVRRWREVDPKGFILKHVVAVSPALNPSRATDAIDASLPIRRYFRRKWIQSLEAKQRCFPELYEFSDIIRLPTIRLMTEKLLRQYSAYDRAEDYFADYSVLGDALEAVSVPTTIITAADDPIIPVDDFHRLERPSTVRLVVQCHGGHNGFVRDLRGRRWFEPVMLRLFQH